VQPIHVEEHMSITYVRRSATRATRRSPHGTGIKFVAILIVLVGGAARLSAQEAEAFEQLNRAFREAHARGRAQVLEQSSPVILVDLETLVLIRNGQRTEAKVVPPLYHRLKAVAHGPLAVYLTLSNVGSEKIEDSKIPEIRQVRTVAKAALDAVSEDLFGPQRIGRQRDILQRSIDFLDQVLVSKSCSPVDLAAFARKLRPSIMANAEEAARIQLDAYDGKVAEWRGQMTAEEWGKLKVVVMGSALPRKDNLATQFFAKVLGEPGEGRRIVYAEALFEEPKALRLLATGQVDAEMAAAFFGDAGRLHRDLLADAASRYLKKNSDQLKSLRAGPR
jgi:hypothetical protein